MHPLVLFGVVVLAVCVCTAAPPVGALRPPAVPLVTHDPYFNVWSCTDRLSDDWTRHWTGTPHAMGGLVRIDGTPYRVLGRAPGEVPALAQRSLRIWPTRTIYELEAGGVALELAFTTPALPDDFDVLARPVTYVSWRVRSTDGAPHEVALYFDVTAEWVVDHAGQEVAASRVRVDGLDVLRFGTRDQRILGRAGDNVRIDWGYLYLAVPDAAGAQTVIAGHHAGRGSFAQEAALPATDDLRFPRAANDDYPVLAVAFDLGRVAADPVERHVLLAYDDLYSIEHMQRRLRPYWRRGGDGPAELLRRADAEYGALGERCRAFDEALVADLTQVGGPRYAELATLAYRQCLAAHKLAADWDGRPLMFSKECFSNGCIGTVDVIYPAAPLFLLLAPALLEAQVVPLLDYAVSPRWPHPFAPHDLGTYPLANGQVYGGGERTVENQMPVEECGNMLLLVAALARATDDAALARRFWPTLTQWAEYLREHGLDPENQLCTDDFAGHLAHNANLSLKAILALAAYAQLAERLGHADAARQYGGLAEAWAGQWQTLAADGNHTVLAFDRPGTWSQKYNLAWDRVLGLGVFPPAVAAREVAWYRQKLNRYGLPLDSRAAYTKLDWAVWSATLAESRADFEALVHPLCDFVNDTPDRVPLTDWFSTTDARCVGFRARSVVGGVYMPMLKDAGRWEKWSR